VNKIEREIIKNNLHQEAIQNPDQIALHKAKIANLIGFFIIFSRSLSSQKA
jgi:hypothetical protein